MFLEGHKLKNSLIKNNIKKSNKIINYKFILNLTHNF